MNILYILENLHNKLSNISSGAMIAIALLIGTHLCMKKFLGNGMIYYIIMGFAKAISLFGVIYSVGFDFVLKFNGNAKFIPNGSFQEIRKKLALDYKAMYPNGYWKDSSYEARRNLAQKLYPEEKYAFMFKTIPSYARKDLYYHGKLCTGYDASYLAGRKFTLNNIKMLSDGSLLSANKFAKTFFFWSTLVGLLITCFSTNILNFETPAWIHADGVGITPLFSFYLFKTLNITFLTLGVMALSFVTTLFLTPIITFRGFSNNVKQFAEEAQYALTAPCKDALVLWKHKYPELEKELMNYNKSIDKVIACEKNNLPINLMGYGTGIAQAKGHPRGINKGQMMFMDYFSQRQNKIVLGGTGSGKTKYAIEPEIYRYSTQKLPEGYKKGIYITCGKGVMPYDIFELDCIKARKDRRMIGAKLGEYGINVVQGMSALDVATMFSTIIKQVIGDKGDIFWTQQAATIFQHCAEICNALRLLPDIENNPIFSIYNPWSLLGINQLACVETDLFACCELLENAKKEILEKLKNNEPVDMELAEKLLSRELSISMAYATRNWKEMAKETRSSVIANVSVLTGQLASAGKLTDRFFTGKNPAEEVCDVDWASNGGVLGIGVGEAEWGVPGQVVAVWLKTRFMMNQRKKQAQEPERIKKESVLFVADEFQLLATSGGTESDTGFWNINRSANVYGIFGTQSLIALEKRLGKEATQNMLDNFRTVIALRSESLETNEYCAKLAGNVIGGYAPEEGTFENYAQRQQMLPDLNKQYTAPVDLSPSSVPVIKSLMLGCGLMGFCTGLASVIIYPLSIFMNFNELPVSLLTADYGKNTILSRTMRKVFAEDRRFQSSNSIFGKDDAGVEHEKDIVHRSEDKSLEAIKNLKDEPLFKPTDLMNINDNQAFAFVQCMDNYRVDIIELNTETGNGKQYDDEGTLLEEVA